MPMRTPTQTSRPTLGRIHFAHAQVRDDHAEIAVLVVGNVEPLVDLNEVFGAKLRDQMLASSADERVMDIRLKRGSSRNGSIPGNGEGINQLADLSIPRLVPLWALQSVTRIARRRPSAI